MRKLDLKYNEKTLINQIVKLNRDLLKGVVYDEDSLKRELKFHCKDYLKKELNK